MRLLPNENCWPLSFIGGLGGMLDLYQDSQHPPNEKESAKHQLSGRVPNPEFRILLGAVSARSAGPGSAGSGAFRGSLPRLASAEAGEAVAPLPGLLWERIAKLDLAAFGPPPSD